ncbi:MAG TPA: bifunctional nuclease domain-containing protein [Acidimicrobiales bacterium]|nr:bifunctional nuclease domain-containing protein [Acidimicrobiales bacterium]
MSNQQAMPPPEFRMAIVGDVNITLPSQFPTVVLRETEAPRRQLSFTVGMQDGVGLSHALRRIPTPRPLTHELITDVLSGFDIDVVAIRMVGRQGKTYFAELDLRGRTGRNVYSCRPTDALAIALHQPVPVPILIDPRLFEEEGDVAPWSPPTPVADAPTPAAEVPAQVAEVPAQVDSSDRAAEPSTTPVDLPVAETAIEPPREGAAKGNSPVPPAEHPTALTTPAAEGVGRT